MAIQGYFGFVPYLRKPGCPPAPPSDHTYAGLGVSLVKLEAWKPQKVGGCGWTRCPRNSVLSHVAQDTTRPWFRARSTQTAHIHAIFCRFWAVSRTHRGFRGQQRAVGHRAIEAHVECRNRLPSFGRIKWVSGPIWAKKGCFGAQNVRLSEGTSRLGATGEFLAQNLDLERAPPRL